MGWLRLVGSSKIKVSLQNIGLFCRALLQKRPIFLRSLLIVATPYAYAEKYAFLWKKECQVADMGWLQLVECLKI